MASLVAIPGALAPLSWGRCGVLNPTRARSALLGGDPSCPPTSMSAM
nr:hypothetical protein [Cystobacter sp.]